MLVRLRITDAQVRRLQLVRAKLNAKGRLLKLNEVAELAWERGLELLERETR